MTAAGPDAVERMDDALAEWLASFTVPAALGAEMAAACAAGAAWAGAIAAGAVRRAGWPDPEALAWGIAVGSLAGALEAGRESLGARQEPAHALLAADGLIAAAHEALGALEPERLGVAMAALSEAFRDGGAWRRLSAAWPRPAWPVLVPLALAPAAAGDPAGPWGSLAEEWRDGAGGAAPPAVAPNGAADRATRALFRAAARQARSAGDAAGNEADDGF